jgi:serine palmitoyltransferase
MLYHPGKIAAFGRLTLARGIAAVVVGFPATPLLTSRARICISAAHTREDLDRAIAALQEVAEECALNYNVSMLPDLATGNHQLHAHMHATASSCHGVGAHHWPA